MIIFGTRTRNIATTNSSATCTSCDEKKMFFNVQGTYAHIMWIPTIPFGKKVYSWCGHCQVFLELSEMPQDQRNKAREFRSQTPYPKWFFSGIILFTLLIGGSVLFDKMEKSNLPKYVNDPQIGDIYYIEEKPNVFTSLKIDSFDSDSLYFYWNSLYVSKSYDISEIDQSHNYQNVIYGTARETINERFEEGTIIKIKR
ncbi:hypothetical protein OAC51_03095 [Flavobacteriaceae bacterium]|mgnify:CR=1 FL=1|nr:hypothetical protein [Flavobacteriaceae bacterium]